MSSQAPEGRLELLQIYRLLQCVHRDERAEIEKLVRFGVENLINVTEPGEGKGVLHLAVLKSRTDMLELLLALGARPDVQDKLGRTPAMLGAELGHETKVALLIKNHADMKLTDAEGKGVLFYCLYPTARHLRCLQMALNAAADANNTTHTGVPVLLEACQSQCEDISIVLLQEGADPNAACQVSGRSALMEAVRAGALVLVKEILKRGANANTLDIRRFNAVHFAAEAGHLEILQLLSAYAAVMGVMTADGDTALHMAARGGFTHCCRFLAQRGCNPKLKNLEGLLPRQIAKELGHKAAAKELKKAERSYGKFPHGSGDVWALTLHDWSHEHQAELHSAFDAASNGIEGIELVSSHTFLSVLQQLGAPAQDEQLQRILLAHDKRREGLINVDEFFKGVRFLPKTFVLASYGPKKKKKAGHAGKSKKKSKLNVPLPICTVPPELVRRRPDGGPPHFMIESYQLVTDYKRFDRDRPPLHAIEDDTAWYLEQPEKLYVDVGSCVRGGDLESLRLAFSCNVPVDVKDRFYKTPLMTACASGNYEVAKFLLDLGADVNASDQFGWTALHHACLAGQLELLELLVEAGAAVEHPALNGATPLMRAVQSGRVCCVDFLLKTGAELNSHNRAAQNCLDIARAYADFRMVELIQAKMDSLPKPKDKKKIKTTKTSAKSRPATSASPPEQQGSSGPPAQTSADSTVKREVKVSSVVLQNARLGSKALNKVDISFVPKTAWGNQTSSRELMERKERRRQHFSHQVDFEDFRMPFNKKLQGGNVQLSEMFD